MAGPKPANCVLHIKTQPNCKLGKENTLRGPHTHTHTHIPSPEPESLVTEEPQIESAPLSSISSGLPCAPCSSPNRTHSETRLCLLATLNCVLLTIGGAGWVERVALGCCRGAC